MNASAVALALLLAWDAAGLDLHVSRWFGSAHGFALRDSWWASTLLHDGGRLLAWLLLAGLALTAWRAPALPVGEPGRRRRWRWLGVMLLCALLVPALKRVSGTSCPWDLAEFGGVARHVPHWLPGVADGGPGHCFPSGHAVAAFAFFGMVFLWRPIDRARARLWLAGVLLAGSAFGIGQLVRGAHFPSHTLWSAWLCWTVCAGAEALGQLVADRWPKLRRSAALVDPGHSSGSKRAGRGTLGISSVSRHRVTASPTRPLLATDRRRTPPLRRGRRGRA